MKLYRNAIILVVVFALLFGVYLAVLYKKGLGPVDTGRDSMIKVVDINSSDIVELTIDGQGERFVFTRPDGEWTVSVPAGFNADKDRINSIAINISYLIAQKVIDENPSDLAQYGLDKPTRVTFKTKDGNVKTIEIGNETPTRGSYYIKAQDAPTVYTIDSYTGEKLKASKNDFRLKQLFDFGPDDVISFSMDRKGQALFKSNKVDSSTWSIDYPVLADANPGAVVPMVEAVTQAWVSEYIEDNVTDLGKYGLANPAYSFEIKTSTGSYKLQLGKEKVQGSEIYAKFGDSNDVFTLSLESFGYLDKPLEEIIEAFAYIVNISDVNRIVLEMDGHTDTYDIKTDPDDKDKDMFTVNGKDATLKDEDGDQYFRKHYTALIGVTLDKIEVDGNPTGKADITITYYLKNSPGTMKVEFIPKDSRYYYVVKNDVYSGILVEKKKIDKPEGIRDTYKLMMDALSK